ncbi:MAG TPA: AIR synthase related protein, partial [Candidatus Bathyarchaeia archaeon]|nr:AIR synthase related protein [Candidatus Bathyarchaeia archaeon]
ILAIAEKYDLNGAIIGEVIAESRYIIEHRGAMVADVPIKLLTEGAPSCSPYRSNIGSQLQAFPAPRLPLREKALRVLSSPNVATREWIYQQYDHEVQTRTVVKPGDGAAVLAIDGLRGVVLSSGCNPSQVAIDPFKGAAATVFENAMNLAVKGATPVAFVNCLNFGNPENAEIFAQLAQTVSGLSYAARILDIPIVGGNVSLYNESEEFHTAIIPTPSIGMVGVLDNVALVPRGFFQQGGDVIIIIGETQPEYGGSEYGQVFELAGAVPQPGETTKATIDALIRIIETRKVTAACAISRGGIIATLAKMCKHLGADVNLSSCLDDGDELFSESAGRALLTLRPKDVNSIGAVLDAHNVPYSQIGTVCGTELAVSIGSSRLTLPLETIRKSLAALTEKMV